MVGRGMTLEECGQLAKMAAAFHASFWEHPLVRPRFPYILMGIWFLLAQRRTTCGLHS